MNDIRSDYWRKNIDDSSAESNAKDIDVAVAVSDGGRAKNAIALVKLKTAARFLYIEIETDEDGRHISESSIEGPREICEINMTPEARKRLGIR